ncbi:S-adenosylmethionine uptake transporter [Saliniradius amylolyticus]|uniref:S-adenosylmethionine uptake transporter n=1 Tax=Saliniradius amylolyticus TaxID=2183582 RepID=A0A2S2E1H3_9ALTE|nr:DMT family transporter [Saliniradius amylolyticus]AWL11488.1 S-adenosylmethionine uptake transporter [Saliniradius amylolyticus]
MNPSIWIGALSLILAEALFAGVGAMVKHLSDSASQTQLVFFRNLFALIALLPVVGRLGLTGLKTQKPALHIIRATSGLIAMYCFFYVLSHIPLAQAMMALLIAPFVIPFIARFWLREIITTKTWVAMAIGFCGAGFVLQPNEGGISIYIALALLCACLVAFTKCAIRKMSDTEPSARTVFYFTGIATLVSLFPMLINWQPMSDEAWLWLIAMGIMAAAGQLLMTKSFQLASPARIGLLTYTNVLFAAGLGYWFWNETLSSGLFIGIGLIIWAGNITLRQRWLI